MRGCTSRRGARALRREPRRAGAPLRSAAIEGSSGLESGANEDDDDDEEEEEEDYTWEVGGANDLRITHLRDVYRGDEPLTPLPSPFCTQSSCPLSGPRTSLKYNSNFVSNRDRVLLNSVAFGSAAYPTQTCSAPEDVYNPGGCAYVPKWVMRAGPRADAVSYTHLTLPTILLV